MEVMRTPNYLQIFWNSFIIGEVGIGWSISGICQQPDKKLSCYSECFSRFYETNSDSSDFLVDSTKPTLF